MSTLERTVDMSETQVPPSGARRFVTTLAPMEQQIGAHVLDLLRSSGTVAVLTTVTVEADGRQHVVSLGLDRSRIDAMQTLVDRPGAARRSMPCGGLSPGLEVSLPRGTADPETEGTA